MEDLQTFVANYQDSCFIPDVPDSIHQYFNVISCLKDGDHQQVFLIKGNGDDKKYILKVASHDNINKLMREHRLLLQLHDNAFPHPIVCFSSADHAYLIREYIPGRSLADYLDSCEALPQKEIVSIACKVCEFVEKLHDMNPPIIHRDIKPQNIIISDSGTIHLVDLDTVQPYAPQKQYDTEVLGTAATAAPEQFGYKRCDVRADVYGIGMLLVYLLTGDYDVHQLRKIHVSPALLHIIRKCLHFDPEKRYQSVRHLHKQLLIIGTHRRSLTIKLVCAALICAATIGIFTNPSSVLASMENTFQQLNKHAYQFKSPVIEKAVRLQLNREEGNISLEDLRSITELCLCGDTPFLHWEEAHSFGFGLQLYGKNFDGGYSNAGDLRDLDYMPNLRKLSLIRLNLTDIAPLVNLPLTHLSICDNRITDLKPLLAKMKTLQGLDVSNNPISDLSGMEELAQLDVLNISSTLVNNLTPITGMKMQKLWFYMMPTNTDLSPLLTMTRLQDFGSSGMRAGEVSILGKVHSLSNIILFFSEVDSLDPFINLQNLYNLNIYACNLKNLDGISSFKRLISLSIEQNAIKDLTPLIGNPSIEKVVLCDNPVQDLSPLEKMQALKTLVLTHEQEVYLSKSDIELPFTVEYAD